jgi:hypothetical protein
MTNQEEDKMYQNKYLEVLNDWDVERLYIDLAKSKLKIFGGRPDKKLSVKEQACLRGILGNNGPKKIATEFHLSFGALRAELCDGLYKFIKDLTGESFERWWSIPGVLEKAGYKCSSTVSIPPETSLTPSTAVVALTILNEQEIVNSSSEIHRGSWHTLELEIGLSSESSELIAEILKDFEHITNTFQLEQHPQIKFNITQQDNEEARKEFRTPNAYDIIMLDDPWIPAYGDIICPLDDFLVEQNFAIKSIFGDKFIESFKHVCVDQYQQIAALPLLGNVQLLIHRCDIQKKIAPQIRYQLNRKLEYLSLSPLQDFYSVVQGTEIHPLIIRDDTDNEVVEVFWEILRALNYKDGYMEDGAVIVNRCRAEEASRWMYGHSLHPTGYIRPIGFTDIQKFLLTENSHMAVTLGWPGWVSYSLSKDASVLNEIEFQRLAQHPVMGAWCLALPREPKHTDPIFRQYAVRVMLALTTDPQIQFLLAQRGNIPVLANFLKTQTLRKIPFWRRNYSTICDALSDSLPRPRSRYWLDFEAELARQIRRGCFRDIPGKVVFSDSP